MAKVVINNDQEIRVVGVGNQQPIKVVKIGPVATIPGGGGVVDSVVAGAGVSVNSTDPANPVVSNAGVITATAGSGISINATDPQNIVITNTGSGGSPGSPDTAVQFNSGGSFAGDANFTYNTGRLAVGTTDFTTQPHSRVRTLSDGTGSGHSDATGIWSRAVNGVDSTAGGIFEAYGNDAWPGSIIGISAQATTTTNAGQSGIGANINIDADGVTSTADSYGILVGNNQPGNVNGTVRGYAIKARSAGSGTRPRIGVWSAINTVATGSAAIRAEVETPGAGIYAGVFNGGNVGFKTSTPQATVDIEAADVRINGVTYQWPAADGSAGQFLQTDGAGNLTWATGSGGSGTVTSMSVTHANGITGSVANPTTTPAITLSIDDASVALTKIDNAAANSKLLGSGATGAGFSYTEITLGTNLSMSGTTLNATGGGGGLLYVTENLDTASPNNTRNNEQLVVTGTPSIDADLSIVPRGAGAFQLGITDSTIAGGNKRGTYAIDLQLLRGSATTVASGDFAVISGGQSNTADGYNSTICGGYLNRASSNYPVIGGGEQNIITVGADFSNIVGGYQNVVQGLYASIAGGRANQILDIYGFAVGDTNTAAAEAAAAIGSNNAAQSVYTLATGRQSNADKRGQHAHASGAFSAPGDAQTSLYVLRTQTIDATANIKLTLDYPGVGNLQMILGDNTAWTFDILLVAKDTGTTNTAHWRFSGGIIRGAGAGTTALVGVGETIVIGNTIGGTSTAVIAADAATGALSIQVTGVAATIINWVASVRTVELTV